MRKYLWNLIMLGILTMFVPFIFGPYFYLFLKLLPLVIVIWIIVSILNGNGKVSEEVKKQKKIKEENRTIEEILGYNKERKEREEWERNKSNLGNRIDFLYDEGLNEEQIFDEYTKNFKEINISQEEKNELSSIIKERKEYAKYPFKINLNRLSDMNFNLYILKEIKKKKNREIFIMYMKKNKDLNLTEEEKKKSLKEIKKDPKNDFLDLIFYLKRSLNKTDEEIFDMYMKRIKELNLNEEQKNTLLKIIKNPFDYMFDDFDLEF